MSNEPQFVVSSSPHIHCDEDVRSIMLDVCIALGFPLVIAVYFFGWRALVLTLISVFSCVFFEWAYRKLLKKESSVRDLSAVVTGMLLAFSLSASTPYWIVILGAFFAIVVTKQLFGGLGCNFLNPALSARVFLLSFPTLIAIFPNASPGELNLLPLWGGVDAVSAATPLSESVMGGVHSLPLDQFSFQEMFLGQMPGSLGEVSKVILLLGGLYLVVRRVITPRIPLCFLGSVAALTYLFPLGGNTGLDWMLSQLLSGGLVLGAVFMATDYTTSPVTKTGQCLFGLGCGALTVFLRYYGSPPEGVAYAILLMNTTVWLLDKAGMPRRFGKKRLAFLRKEG